MVSNNKPSKASANTNAVAQNLDQLKGMVANATKFSDPMYFFMDHLVMDDRFIKAGVLSQDEKVATVFRVVCEMLYQQEKPAHTETAQKRIIHHLKAFNFFHGAYQIGRNMVTLIYFQDIDQGMAVMAQLSGAGMTRYSRFTAHQFFGKDGVNFVPGNPQQTH